MMIPHFDTDALRRLSSKMLLTAKKYASHGVASSSSTTPLSIELDLHPPKPLTHQLRALGLDASSSSRISSAMLNAASRLKAICEDDFQRRRLSLQSAGHYFQDSKALSRLSSTYHIIYTKTINDWSSYLLEDLTPRVLALGSAARTQHRRPFSQNAVTILERFFAHNPFPSTLEKYELASKCALAYKQIKIWFQNHRSRTRKNGTEPMQRTQTSAILEDLKDTVINVILPTEPEDDDDHDSFSYQWGGGFDVETPAHAYPSSYPPQCDYDPFPDTPEKRNLQTPWPRLPNLDCERHLSLQCPSPSDLAEALSRMSIRDDMAYADPARPPSHPPSRPSHILGYVTVCSRAPLPALLGSVAPTKLHGADRRSKKQNKSSTQDECSAISPTSHTTSACRPKCTLPRRAPRHPPLGYGAREWGSPFPIRESRRPAGRTPSRRPSLSSSVTCVSDRDSPLSTPVLSPASLPSRVTSNQFDSLGGFKPASTWNLPTATTMLAWDMTSDNPAGPEWAGFVDASAGLSVA